MSRTKSLSLILAGIAVAALLAWALMPAPETVSVTEVRSGYFAETVEDEGRTALRERYTVSSPIGGFLRRVGLEPGDRVEADDTLFELEGMPAPAFDARTQMQAREEVEQARARVEAARAELEARESDYEQAAADLSRNQRLHLREMVSTDELDRARTRRDSARAAVRSARYQVDVARFELAAARTRTEIAGGERDGDDQAALQVRAPLSGVVTARHRQHEGPVRDGEAILEIGDLDDLEVRVDLLSMDAVRVEPGMRVVIERWGGDDELSARVRRVEPAGFEDVSALGVDEQRVPVRVAITSPREQWRELGDGYRVEARFILWEDDDVLQVPTSALFRRDDQWRLFAVEDGRAVARAVEIGRRSGLRAEIEAGVEAGDRVITHPGDRISDGIRVRADDRDR